MHHSEWSDALSHRLHPALAPPPRRGASAGNRTGKAVLTETHPGITTTWSATEVFSHLWSSADFGIGVGDGRGQGARFSPPPKKKIPKNIFRAIIM